MLGYLISVLAIVHVLLWTIENVKSYGYILEKPLHDGFLEDDVQWNQCQHRYVSVLPSIFLCNFLGGKFILFITIRPHITAHHLLFAADLSSCVWFPVMPPVLDVTSICGNSHDHKYTLSWLTVYADCYETIVTPVSLFSAVPSYPQFTFESIVTSISCTGHL